MTPQHQAKLSVTTWKSVVGSVLDALINDAFINLLLLTIN